MLVICGLCLFGCSKGQTVDKVQEEEHEMTLKDTSIRGTVWYLNDYDQDAIIVQTKINAYMLVDKGTYNRWYEEEFTREEIIGELVKRGWRIKRR